MDIGSDNFLARQMVKQFSKHDFFKKEKKKLKTDKLSFSNVQPNEDVKYIMESKNMTKYATTFPKRFSEPLVFNERLQLASLRMKLYNTEHKLVAAREEMVTFRQNIIQKWDDLEKKEVELKNSFIEFNQFVRENFEKRSRAEKKLEYDRRLSQQRQKQIDDLTSKMDAINKVTDIMDKKIRRLALFQHYLTDVTNCENSGFITINDILDRYNSLCFAKDFLLKKLRTSMDIFESFKYEMMKLIEEKNFAIMGLNNQIANLQARYENANIKALESEELVTQIKNSAVKQLQEIDSVKNAIWNVYVHMATSKKHPIKIKRDNVEEQMMYINRTLTELSKVNKLIKRKAGKVK